MKRLVVPEEDRECESCRYDGMECWKKIGECFDWNKWEPRDVCPHCGGKL